MADIDALLHRWIETVLDPAELGRDVDMNDMRFPNDKIRSAFLSAIRSFDEETVVAVLDRFLIPQSYLPGADALFWATAEDFDLEAALCEYSEEEQERRLSYLKGPRYVRVRRRMHEVTEYPTWEGITWIRQLVPSAPQIAIETLDAYVLAHPDLFDAWRWGISDAQAVIQAWYIGEPSDNEDRRQLLLTLDPYDFEHLAVNLYGAMGYEVSGTPRSGDKGIDGYATWPMIGQRDRIIMQCRRYTEDDASPSDMRELSGALHGRPQFRGVFISATGFEPGAVEEAQRVGIEPITGGELAVLLNQHAGYRWPDQLQYWIRNPETERQQRAERERLLAARLGLSSVAELQNGAIIDTC